jgi:hypothetical protein
MNVELISVIFISTSRNLTKCSHCSGELAQLLPIDSIKSILPPKSYN